MVSSRTPAPYPSAAGRAVHPYDLARRSHERAQVVAGRLEGRTVLDFGTHKGAIASLLAGEGFEVTAVAPGLGKVPGVTTIAGMLDPDGIRRLGTFDHVLALSVLHHCTPWRDYWQALAEVARLSVIVETPREGEPVPSQPGLAPAFTGFPVIGTFPGKRDGWTRDIVEVARVDRDRY